jgi:hypothetical protein
VSSRRKYVIFNCQACGAKVFAEAEQVGRAGVCPACRQLTGISPEDPSARAAGPPPRSHPDTPPPSAGTPRRSSERRRSRRVRVPDAHVGVEPRSGPTGAIAPTDLAELTDISEGGVSYVARGVPDRKKLTGFGPPPVKVGESITVTLHVPALFRPRTVSAVVRRVDAHATRKGYFRVGIEFLGLAEEARVDLRKIVDSRE